MSYELSFHPDALVEWKKLDAPVREMFKKKLAERLRQMDGQIRVELAFLELMSPRLRECGDGLVADGWAEIAVVPVFLGQGGHVLRDLPLLEQEIRARHPQIDLRVAQAVGEDASVQEAMARYCLSVL